MVLPELRIMTKRYIFEKCAEDLMKKRRELLSRNIIYLQNQVPSAGWISSLFSFWLPREYNFFLIILMIAAFVYCYSFVLYLNF